MNSFFQCGPPFDSRVEIFLSWRSRPPEHGSTHDGEAWTIQIFHVLTFDLIKLAKIGLCLAHNDPNIPVVPVKKTMKRPSRS